MIKTVVFDLGGVCFTRGTALALKTIYKLVNAPKEKVAGVFASPLREEGWLYRKGKITKKEFWKIAVKKLEINKKLIPKLQEIWLSSYKPIKGMKEIVSKLRKNYRVIVFSGTIKERIEYLNKKYNLHKDFDDFILSYKVGFNKDEIRFYKILLKKLKCRPEESVLVDDYQRHLDIAKKFGIKTIIFKNPEQLKSDLRKLNIKI